MHGTKTHKADNKNDKELKIKTN